MAQMLNETIMKLLSRDPMQGEIAYELLRQKWHQVNEHTQVTHMPGAARTIQLQEIMHKSQWRDPVVSEPFYLNRRSIDFETFQLQTIYGERMTEYRWIVPSTWRALKYDLFPNSWRMKQFDDPEARWSYTVSLWRNLLTAILFPLARMMGKLLKRPRWGRVRIAVNEQPFMGRERVMLRAAYDAISDTLFVRDVQVLQYPL